MAASIFMEYRAFFGKLQCGFRRQR